MKSVAACILTAVALAAVACGGSKKVAVVRTYGSARVAASWIGPVGPPTLAHPLAPGARRIALAAAPTALGAAVVLPDVALVGASDVGRVWVAGRRPTERTVAVTFPSQRVIVEYTRPAPSSGSATHFQAVAQGIRLARVVRLGGGVPALVVKQDSDQTGANFGLIAFNVGGSEVRVLGHYGRATLQRVAQSILERQAKQHQAASLSVPRWATRCLPTGRQRLGAAPGYVGLTFAAAQRLTNSPVFAGGGGRCSTFNDDVYRTHPIAVVYNTWDPREPNARIIAAVRAVAGWQPGNYNRP